MQSRRRVTASVIVALTVAAYFVTVQSQESRRVNPADIQVPDGYAIEALARGLSYPTDITFSASGDVYVSEAGGHTYGTAPEEAPAARILQLTPDGKTRVVYDRNVPMKAIRSAASSKDMPEGLIPPVNGVTWHEGRLYIAHRTRVSTLDPKTGTFNTIINGMPSWGFFHNNKVIFGPDGKMYFFLSTQGNAGPIDEHWMKVINIFNKRQAHEVPCEDVTLNGENFPVPVEDAKTPGVSDKKMTGVYVPLGTETKKGQTIKGQVPCNGAMLRANADGSNLEVYAWGLRSDFGYRFSPDGRRLVATQNSGNPIPPREIHDDWEPIYEVKQREWYGWPDFFSSVPITDERFALKSGDKPEGHQIEHRAFVLDDATRKRLLKGRERPPAPLAKLEPHTAAQGLVFGRQEFGVSPEHVLVAEFGTIVPHLRKQAPGFKVQRVDLSDGDAKDFLVNRTPGPASATKTGGLERPLQLEWGPDGALYIVDFGVIDFPPDGMKAQPKTGVIWKLARAARGQVR